MGLLIVLLGKGTFLVYYTFPKYSWLITLLSYFCFRLSIGLLVAFMFYQLSSRIPSALNPVGPGNNAKTPPKRPPIGQKKPLESLGSSPPLSRCTSLADETENQSLICRCNFVSHSLLSTIFFVISDSKKQKVSGTFADQSIDQLNDVTAVSGVNLRVRCFAIIFLECQLIALSNGMLAYNYILVWSSKLPLPMVRQNTCYVYLYLYIVQNWLQGTIAKI